MGPIVAQRLHGQLLADKHFQTAEETVGWMLAIQGQDYHPAIWAIGLRTPGITKQEIEQEISEMKIVRSWTMRHTIHFVTLEDLSWMVELSRDRMLKRYKNHMKKEAGLEEETLERAVSLMQKALSGKKMISRPVLRSLLENAQIDTSGQRYYHMLWYAAQKGIIFIGPMEGKQQTFGLVADWAPKSKFQTREAALEELARRYLASHGPATAKDLAWWAGLSVTEAKHAIALAGGFDYEEVTTATPTLRLLPTLDEFLIGYQDRTAPLPEAMHRWLDPLKRGFYRPLLFNGQVVGSWETKVNKKTITVAYRISPDTEIPEALLVAQAQAYATFFEFDYKGIEKTS